MRDVVYKHYCDDLQPIVDGDTEQVICRNCGGVVAWVGDITIKDSIDITEAVW